MMRRQWLRCAPLLRGSVLCSVSPRVAGHPSGWRPILPALMLPRNTWMARMLCKEAMYPAFDQSLTAGKPPCLKTFTRRIRGIARCADDAWRMRNEMEQLGLTLDVAAYNVLIGACKGEVTEALRFYEEMKSCKIDPSSATFTALIGASVGRVDIALDIMGEMSQFGLQPNETTFGALLQCCDGRKSDIALVVRQMEHRGIGMTMRMVNILVASARSEDDALMWVNEAVSCGLKPDQRTIAALIESQSLSTDVATDLLLRFRILPNTVQFNVMLKNMACDDAAVRRCLECMDRFCVIPDHVTLATILGLQDLSHHTMTWAFKHVARRSVTPSRKHYLMLAAALGHSAEMLLDFVREMKAAKVPISAEGFNILLNSCAADRERLEAVREEMKQCGVQPDAYTYVALVRSCGDDLDRAWEYIKEMEGSGLAHSEGVKKAMLKVAGGDSRARARVFKYCSERGMGTERRRRRGKRGGRKLRERQASKPQHEERHAVSTSEI